MSAEQVIEHFVLALKAEVGVREECEKYVAEHPDSPIAKILAKVEMRVYRSGAEHTLFNTLQMLMGKQPDLRPIVENICKKHGVWMP